MDVTGDGGVLVSSICKLEAHGKSVVPGRKVTLNYSVKVESNDAERLVDSQTNYSFIVGRGDVVAGLDAAVQSMSVGETAKVVVRHDYGYGEHGLTGKLPPHSTLVFEVTLNDAADTSASEGGEEATRLQLPSSENSSERTLTVGGSALALDHLGPIVINSDGSTSRIANWTEMNPAEQEKTARLIKKRNQKRLASAGAPETRSE